LKSLRDDLLSENFVCAFCLAVSGCATLRQANTTGYSIECLQVYRIRRTIYFRKENSAPKAWQSL
jgi:hypothetical protein